MKKQTLNWLLALGTYIIACLLVILYSYLSNIIYLDGGDNAEDEIIFILGIIIAVLIGAFGLGYSLLFWLKERKAAVEHYQNYLGYGARITSGLIASVITGIILFLFFYFTTSPISRVDIYESFLITSLPEAICFFVFFIFVNIFVFIFLKPRP